MWGLECDMQIQLSWYLAVCNKKRLNSGTAEIYGGFLFQKPLECKRSTVTSSKQDGICIVLHSKATTGLR